MGRQSLRYGPRFRSSAVSSKASYDEYVAKTSVPGWAPYLTEAQKVRGWWKSSGMSHNRARGISLANGETTKQPAIIDEYYEAELRTIERVKQAVNLLVFAVEELSSAPALPAHLKERKHRLVNQSYLVDLITRLCTAIKIKRPDFNFEHRAGVQLNRKCLDCGAALSPDDGDICPDCRPDTSSLKAVSDMRREREREEQSALRQMKRMKKELKAIERAIKCR